MSKLIIKQKIYPLSLNLTHTYFENVIMHNRKNPKKFYNVKRRKYVK